MEMIKEKLETMLHEMIEEPSAVIIGAIHDGHMEVLIMGLGEAVRDIWISLHESMEVAKEDFERPLQ